jgi:hypothetical protein
MNDNATYSNNIVNLPHTPYGTRKIGKNIGFLVTGIVNLPHTPYGTRKIGKNIGFLVTGYFSIIRILLLGPDDTMNVD